MKRKIICHTNPKSFWCKKCKKSTNILIKIGELSYCESCYKGNMDELEVEDWGEKWIKE